MCEDSRAAFALPDGFCLGVRGAFQFTENGFASLNLRTEGLRIMVESASALYSFEAKPFPRRKQGDSPAPPDKPDQRCRRHRLATRILRNFS